MISIVAVILIGAPFLWWYLWLHKFKSLDSIPGPKPLPFIGNALDLGNTPQEFRKNCVQFSEQYGDLFKVYVANELKIFIARAEVLEHIMNSNVHITKSNGYDLLKPWLNVGLLMSTGKKWKLRRKMITPSFHFKILERFLETFNANGDILVEKLKKEAGKGPFDVYPYINLFSLDIICETSMRVKVASQDGNNMVYVKSVRDFLNIFMVRFFSAWKKFDTLFRLSPDYKIHTRLLEILQNFSTNVIVKRRAEKSPQTSQKANSDDADGIRRKVALLDMLLESEHSFSLTNDDIKEEINTFMFEGHDTTTSGVCFAILSLATYPDVQDKVYDEISSVVGDEEYVTMKHLQETKYLDMVIKEVQRLYPAVPFVERRLETDVSIDDINFPKGTTLTLYIYGIHQNEKYFPNPDVFDPNRFLPQKQSERHNYAYVPFSAGPRNCIGQKFAMLDMKIAVIKVLQKYRILSVPNYKPELGFASILKSYNGIRIQLEQRVK